MDRGSYSTLTCYPGSELKNNYSLNTVDICPVGALTSIDFRFKMRVWFLKQTDSIDIESSVGANTTVWSREGVIYRITPRRHDEVNDTWMTDSGRLLYKEVRAPDRLAGITVNGVESALDMAINAAAALLREAAGKVAVIGSGQSSVEEQYLTRQLARSLGAATYIVSRVAEGDKILLSSDRNPNVRGALVTGLISALPTPKLTGLAASLASGGVKALVVINEDLAAAGIEAAHLAGVTIIYLGTTRNTTSEAAAVVLPTLTVFEKSGTFINQQFRIQKFHRAVPPVRGTFDDLAVLGGLASACGGAAVPTELGSVWRAMAAEIPTLATMAFNNIPDTGLLLDRTPWAGLPYIEAETLHYKPEAPVPPPELNRPATPPASTPT